VTSEPLRALEIVRAAPEHAAALAAFLTSIEAPEERLHFSPHPFDTQTAHRICAHEGLDLYYLLITGTTVLAYGMLRGWDAGFAVPSLGITVHPAHRGRGLGRLMISFLHAAAMLRGSERVRLKVREDNSRAISLYRTMGYGFGAREGPFLVGYAALKSSAD
jgi:ribosomal-protein-alanine N-acetyltransferase